MKKDEEKEVTEHWRNFFSKSRDIEVREEDTKFLNPILEKVVDEKNFDADGHMVIGKFIEYDARKRRLIYQGLNIWSLFHHCVVVVRFSQGYEGDGDL